MATDTLVSINEYLSTSYSPDCDYVDGVIEERNWGEKDHSKLQGATSVYFHNRRKEWGLHVFPEQRVQVSPTRFRAPDVCVVLVLTFGVPYVWLLDPRSRQLRTENPALLVPLAEIFE